MCGKGLVLPNSQQGLSIIPNPYYWDERPYHILTCGSDARSPVPELSGQGSGSMGDPGQKLSRLLNAMRMMVV